LKILKVLARQVLDSRGSPTVEAEVLTSKGRFSAMVPSGASTGEREALELRDGGRAYMGKSVTKAVENVKKVIAPKIVGLDATLQDEVDRTMIALDGTKTKSNLGANAILAVSMAVCRAGAASEDKPLYAYLAKLSGRKGKTLPVMQLNVMNGGKHAGLENDIQEQMMVPAGAKSYSEALQMGVEAYYALKDILHKKFGPQGTLLGDEGGFVPKVSNVEERLEYMVQAIEQAGYSKEIFLALDPASSEFYNKGEYNLYGKLYSSEELIDFYRDLVSKYGVLSLEDGMAENDWQGWKMLTAKLGDKINIVGDDLLVTNTEYIQRAIREESCNALLLKLNQIGTVTEAIDAANLSFKNGWQVVVSHRSGETEDTFIADLVVGLDAGQSKFGGPARSDRNAKYNQLSRIEEALGDKATYAGMHPFKR
jgi:enolase